MASVFYEHLPTLCLCCGVIGHREPACGIPTTSREIRYNQNLAVKPTHPDDYRRRNDRQQQPQLAIIAHVAKVVSKLSIQDKDQGGSGTIDHDAAAASSPAIPTAGGPLSEGLSQTNTTVLDTHDTRTKISNDTNTIHKLKTYMKGWKRLPRKDEDGQSKTMVSTKPPAPHQLEVEAGQASTNDTNTTVKVDDKAGLVPAEGGSVLGKRPD
ncbi:hypothetical protein ACQ4PT_057793 [Festuca glaucescens]